MGRSAELARSGRGRRKKAQSADIRSTADRGVRPEVSGLAGWVRGLRGLETF
jgi:hypothetical protein